MKTLVKIAVALLIGYAAVNAQSCSSSSKTTTTKTTTTTKSTTSSKADEYKKYGDKLHTQFKGTEDLALLKEVSEWIGTPYKYASNQKGVGTDCSGFVTQVYKTVYGIQLNRSSYDIIKNVDVVSRNNIKCGDILFFADDKGKIYHVGIYLGQDNFAHAATSKNIGVKVDNLNSTYYKEHFYKAGHVKGMK
ncbi:MAG: C40 family peptidase [Bacteroidales bacterium]|nr:C40 family peptidase [Bacteroidales bacterium]MDD6003768.1 NlpC/P60 family protein [Bacteroidales bacterium]